MLSMCVHIQNTYLNTSIHAYILLHLRTYLPRDRIREWLPRSVYDSRFSVPVTFSKLKSVYGLANEVVLLTEDDIYGTAPAREHLPTKL